MPRLAYVNGRYVPHRDAAVHVEDRGYQFSDGVYEVCSIKRGLMLDEQGHLDRLARSLGELRIAMPMSRAALSHVLREVVRRNRLDEGLVYIQVTRGVAKRDHAFPSPAVPPSLVVTAKPVSYRDYQAKAEKGIAVITRPDQRWARRDIKSVSLLPNVLAIQAARDVGAADTWMVDPNGYITEGTRANAWILDKNGVLITRQLSHDILHGITRKALLKVAAEQGLTVEERAFTPQEAYEAREAFITAATSMVLPVVNIDDHVIGNGAPGSVALALREGYLREAEAEAARLAASA